MTAFKEGDRVYVTRWNGKQCHGTVSHASDPDIGCTWVIYDGEDFVAASSTQRLRLYQEPAPDVELLEWVIRNLLTEEQLDVTPPGRRQSLRNTNFGGKGEIESSAKVQ